VNKKIRFIFLLVTVFMSGYSFASAPTYVFGYSYSGVFYPKSGWDSMCKLMMSDYGKDGHYVFRSNKNYCMANNDNSGSEFVPSGQYQCADGSAPDTGRPFDQQCSEPAPPCGTGPAGDVNVTTAWAGGSGVGAAIAKKVIPDGGLNGSNFCVSSCVVSPSGNPKSCSQDKSPSSNGYYRISCVVPMSTTGASCSPGAAPPDSQDSQPPVKNPVPDGSCPAGSAPAGQDSSGMTICAGKGPAAPAPGSTPGTTSSTPPVTTTASDGSTTTTSSTTKGNSDGSSTTTTTTTVVSPDGKTTTVITPVTTPAPTPAGEPAKPGVEDKPEDKVDICLKHPELNICKNSQVQGECGQVTCTGDAIQCATLRAAATMQCRQKDDLESLQKSSLTGQGSDILSGNDPMKSNIDAALKGDTVDLGSSRLDQSGFLGGGSCFPDKSINVLGNTVTMSFSAVCNNIQPLRYVFLAIGFLVAYLIVSKSVLQG
jgi:hypothetical protein